MSDASHQVASQFTWERSAKILEQAVRDEQGQAVRPKELVATALNAEGQPG